MEKEFVPYELAVKLKELGFDEECFGAYHHANNLDLWSGDYDYSYAVKAPLWQQAFDWFRDIKGLPVSIGLTIDNKGYTFLITNLGKIPKVDHLTFPDKLDYGTYEQARQACLVKLIELITKQN